MMDLFLPLSRLLVRLSAVPLVAVLAGLQPVQRLCLYQKELVSSRLWASLGRKAGDTLCFLH